MAMQTVFLQKLNLDKINGKGYAFLMELKYALFRNGEYKRITIIL
jgi:hypothetical protein